MRSCLSSFVLLVMLLPGLAQAENAPRVEARIYYANPTELKSRLGDLLGRLDVFTVVGPEQGQPYLVIGTDEAQLAEIAARGLYTEVTWASLDDKFRAMTNCEPGSDAGRNFGYYFTYYEMRDTVRKLAQNFPAIARIDSSMKSWLNKPLYCLKISDNVGTAENEPQTFFNGATHAREPMSTHACIAFATLLLRDYGVDSATTWLVNHREIYILPVMNPDGYIYNSDSGGANAYWRKTRCNEGARTGPGVDMNRNFGYRWGLNDYGSSPTPSAETYRGPARWSETESAQLRDFLAAHRFRTQQDFHTYGRYNLLPWGHSLTWPPDSVTWVELGDSMFQNNGYETGPTQWVLYETNGGSTDYAFADTLLNGNPKFVSYGVSSELGIDDFWYGWDLPAYVDSEVGKNIPNCFYLTRVAGVLLRPLGMALDDSVSGNSSGQLDPGETAGVWFSLRNFAVHPLDTARSVTAVLTSPDTLVRVLDSLAGFPDILRRGTGANPTDQFQVQCSPNAAPGTLVNLRLVVGYTDDGMAASQSFIIPLMVGPVYDVGCPKIRVPRGIYDSGTVVTPGCTVVNYGIGSQNYAVRLKIGGTYNNTVAVTAHTPFTRRYITFPAYTAVHRGVQAVICSTELAGDMVPGNNRDTTWLAMQRNDVGCTRLIAPTGTIDSGTSVQPRCSTFNYGTTTPYYYYTRMKVGNFYTNQNYLLYHAPGARGYLTFTAASNWPRGTWTVSCSTQMAADLVPANDRRTGSVTVRVRDVGCRRIVIPAGNVDSGVAVTPSCTLYNYGTSTESYNVRLRIGTGYNTTVAISSHTAGTTRYVTFAGWTPPARGNYVLRCSTEFTGDVVRANDRKIDTARVQVHDLAARAIVAPVDTVLPGPLTPRALVRNYGSLREPARVIFAVDAGATYLDSVVLAAGLPFADTTLNFPAWHALAGSHIAQCSVRLGTEQLPANNAVSAGFNVWQVDFGVERIDAPVGRLDTADEVTPAAKVVNRSNTTLSVPVFFRIDSAGGRVRLDSVMVSFLAPGDTYRVQFAAWPKPHAQGNYTTCCSTAVTGDDNPANDWLAGSFEIRGPVPDTGWAPRADVPAGPRNRKVRDGGCLSSLTLPYPLNGARVMDIDTTVVFALKGNNTCEFFRYNTTTNTWLTADSLPEYGTSGRRRTVRKGATQTTAGGRVYAAKGNNTLEFWVYDPAGSTWRWTAAADVPAGVQECRTGTGAAAVTVGDTEFVYLLKASGTREFYRYNIPANTWQIRANAPLGISGKTFRTGSSLTSNGTDRLWALKGDYNEFFVHDVATDEWSPRADLPLLGPSGRKKKARDGAALAFFDDRIFAFKGGNTREFWYYDVDSDRWHPGPEIPAGTGRNVRAGGALTATADRLFALKGNSTLEYYSYKPTGLDAPLPGEAAGVQTAGQRSPAAVGLRVHPNPIRGIRVPPTIHYTLTRPGVVRLRLFDISGQHIMLIEQTPRLPGPQQTRLPASGLASGIYILELDVSGQTITRKLIIE